MTTMGIRWLGFHGPPRASDTCGLLSYRPLSASMPLGAWDWATLRRGISGLRLGSLAPWGIALGRPAQAGERLMGLIGTGPDGAAGAPMGLVGGSKYSKLSISSGPGKSQPPRSTRVESGVRWSRSSSGTAARSCGSYPSASSEGAVARCPLLFIASNLPIQVEAPSWSPERNPRQVRDTPHSPLRSRGASFSIVCGRSIGLNGRKVMVRTAHVTGRGPRSLWKAFFEWSAKGRCGSLEGNVVTFVQGFIDRATRRCWRRRCQSRRTTGPRLSHSCDPLQVSALGKGKRGGERE